MYGPNSQYICNNHMYLINTVCGIAYAEQIIVGILQVICNTVNYVLLRTYVYV